MLCNGPTPLFGQPSVALKYHLWGPSKVPRVNGCFFSVKKKSQLIMFICSMHTPPKNHLSCDMPRKPRWKDSLKYVKAAAHGFLFSNYCPWFLALIRNKLRFHLLLSNFVRSSAALHGVCVSRFILRTSCNETKVFLTKRFFCIHFLICKKRRMTTQTREFEHQNSLVLLRGQKTVVYTREASFTPHTTDRNY